MKQDTALILASSSPRRRELLERVGLQFSIVSPDVDETVHAGEDAKTMVERLALEKARVVSSGNRDSWVLAADTTVLLDGEILGKPIDKSDALRMLKKLSANTHIVWSAFALTNIAKKVEHCESLSTEVEFVAMSDNEIADYVESGEPMDKAGSYAFQGIGAAFIKRITGSHTNVIGLPLAESILALKHYRIIA